MKKNTRITGSGSRLSTFFAAKCLAGAILIGLSGCTEPGETTQIGAATGGVMGAGLGAIIGSQTGNAGSGLVLGAAAGAGAGALVSNQIEAQQKSMRTQDEALERQQRVIEAQRRELEELRRNNDSPKAGISRTAVSESRVSVGSGLSSADRARIQTEYIKARPTKEVEPFSMRGSSRHVTSARVTQNSSTLSKSQVAKTQVASKLPKTKSVAVAPRHEETFVKFSEVSRVPESRTVAPSKFSSGGVVERDLAVDKEVAAPADEKVVAKAGGAYDWSKKDVEPEASEAKAVTTKDGTDDCAGAASEVKNAQNASETADKLFHYRRALRLCPNRAQYHVALGEVYQSLKRPSDAVYEFKEALNIDPNLDAAKEQLAALGR